MQRLQTTRAHLWPTRTRWYTCCFLLEVGIGVLPQVALYTELLPAARTAATLAAIVTTLLLWQGICAAHSDGLPTQAALADCASRQARFICTFRGLLLLGTCISILAVDFRAFPRRFAKTETWGLALMDMGTGGIVLAGGLVSRTAQHGHNIRDRVAAGLRAAGPCLTLWAARLVSVKAVDYQEHVGEYGVHWNFFATLACLAMLRHVVPVRAAGLPFAASCVALLHQAALMWGGLGDWMRAEARDPDSWISLNKEGLGSVPGYWALALVGSAVGTWIRANVPAGLPNDRTNASLSLLLRCAALCMLSWVAFLAAHTWVEPACRRTANLTYVLWVASHSLAALLVLLAGQLMLPGGLQSVIALAASKHTLPLFLFANLLTGGVNLSIDSLAVGTWPARLLLSMHAALVSAAAAATATLSQHRV